MTRDNDPRSVRKHALRLRFVWRSVISLLTASFIGNLAQAEPTLQACFEDWRPYQYIDMEGAASGLSVDLTRQVLADLGHKVEFSAMPYKRCLTQVLAGKADILVSSQGEEGLVIAKNHKVVWALGFMVRPEDFGQTWTDLAEFNGKTIGIVQQFQYPDSLDAQAQWHYHRAPDDRLNLKMLALKRVDVVMTDVPWALDLPKNERGDARFLPPAVSVAPQPDAFRKGLESLSLPYDEKIGELRASGVLDDLYQKTIGVKLSTLENKAIVGMSN